MVSAPERKLRSLISELRSADNTDSEIISLLTQIVSIVNSVDSGLHSEFMSLILQTISLFTSMNFYPRPDPLWELITRVSHKISLVNNNSIVSASVQQQTQQFELLPLLGEIRRLQPDLKLLSLIDQIFYDGYFTYMKSEPDSDPESDPASEPEPEPEPEPEIELEPELTYNKSPLLKISSEPKPESSGLINLPSEPESEPKPESSGLINLPSEPESESESEPELIHGISSPFNPTPGSVVRSLITEILSLADFPIHTRPRRMTLTSSSMGFDSELVALLNQIIVLINSLDSDSEAPESETTLMSLITQTVSVFNSMDFDSQPKPLSELISLISRKIFLPNSEDSDSKHKHETELFPLLVEISRIGHEVEFISLIREIIQYVTFRSWESSLQAVKRHLELLITQFISLVIYGEYKMKDDGMCMSLITYIIHDIMELDSRFQLISKSESKLMSLIAQATHLFKSMDLDSQPEPLSNLISHITDLVKFQRSQWSVSVFITLVDETMRLEPEPELMSLIHQIISLVYSTTQKWKKLISLCPLQLTLKDGNFHVDEETPLTRNNNQWDCLPLKWKKFRLTGGKYASHFHCRQCNGQNHQGHGIAPVEIKHPLHQKHSLRLSMLSDEEKTRKCYCCDEDLKEIFYCCLACNYAMNMTCVEKTPLPSICSPKWHEHTLSLFPRKTSLICDLCSLADSSCPFYICPPCDFVVHQSCISLPRVIRISRHPHRISFTPSFDQGDCSCGVCQRKVNNDCGGYSCIKDGCSFAVHSRCATQSNVWDGIELEGVPEEVEEELEPFERISNGIIQHFSHQEHHLRLDENTRRNYDDNMYCQACVTPIYFGNFYSCLQCDFILHEECANFSRKIRHPIHPHLLTLEAKSFCEKGSSVSCSACSWICASGFFYECSKEGCDFKVHLQCGTISEPLAHGSHKDPLFLTSKPGEQRRCSVCKCVKDFCTKETFNCIECDFSLCFECATLPQKVRYKHDKHTFTLTYGEDKSTTTSWCEACETKIDPKERIYMCDKDCCVTLHMQCMIGKDLYMKPGSSLVYKGRKIDVLPNNHMLRPICSYCMSRCPYKIAIRCAGLIFCSTFCIPRIILSI